MGIHLDNLAGCSSFVEILRWRAFRQPQKKAYTFLLDGELEESYLTYEDLDCQARAIAAKLQNYVAPGERSLLLYPPGLEFITAFFGCLYAGVVAIPAYPPQFNRPMPRLQSIVADAQAKVVLTTTKFLTTWLQKSERPANLETLQWLATDDIAGGVENAWYETAVTSDSLAFLQYTSGSTGTPKGVIVSHGNLLHNQRLIQTAFEHTERSLVVGWLPLFHDMGLIGNMLQPLYLGIPCVLMSPTAFLTRPLRWLTAISRYKATTSGGPNFAYDLCASKIAPEERSTLDLSSWQVAFNGAEPIRPETMVRFARTFADCGFEQRAFYPCYGMAETTLIVSGGKVPAPPILQTVQKVALEQNRVVPAASSDDTARTLVGCGRVLQDLQVVIAHPKKMTRCNSDEIGEIWVSGASVTQGYWNRIEQTKQTFHAYLQDTGEGPFLRTGDLGFLQSGEVFITGRLKDLIIIRGRNHYPQDIELTVENSHPALQPTCSAAFSVDVAGVERLAIIVEVKRTHLRHFDAEEVIRAIRQSVAENHDLQVYGVLLLKPGKIPKTSSGKIQRHACSAGFLNGSLDVVASDIWQETDAINIENCLSWEALLTAEATQRQPLLESYLQEQVAGVLKILPAGVNSQQPLSSLGLDSLMAIELANGIEANLGVALSMTSFLQGSNIAEIANEVLAGLTAPGFERKSPIAPANNASAEYPLSYGQRAMWFLHQLAPESPAYNIASALRIKAELNIPALQRAFEILVERHSVLRTTFTAVSGEPVQKVNEHISLWFQKEDASTWNEDSLKERLHQEAARPFNLEQGPLLRVNLFARSPQEHILLLAVHHIVADFWSISVLVRELGMLYQAEKDGTPVELDPLPLQYADYSGAVAQVLASPRGEQLMSYWLYQLAGELPVLNLPTDRPRPAIQTYRGASVPFKLSAALTEKLNILSRTYKATLYMTLLAAFQVLLYRYTGQKDILVGSPTAGRSSPELAGLVGYFVNPVVLRAELSGDLTFKGYLDRVRQTVLEAFERQDYPFALLVERLQPVRDPSRSPLFQTMFVLQKAPKLDEKGLTVFALGETGASMQLGELELESLALEQRVAQFDLTLTMADVEGRLAASFEYNSDLFEASTIQRMAGHFQTLLEAIVANPQQQLSELPLLTAEERHQILIEWNDTTADYPKDKCIHQLIEAQVDRAPDAVAVVFATEQIAYRELNRRANQLARHLTSLGVQPEVRVGICMERSLEMLVGLLGILKAGGAYVPLDPSYPPERLAFMLEDARLSVLLTTKNLVAMLPAHETHIVCLDTDWEVISRERGDNPVSSVQPDNLAYVIYTSGSTGQPKGVMIQHNSLVNFTETAKVEYELSERDRVLQFASISFDVAAEEIYSCLTCGGTLVLRTDEMLSSVPEFLQACQNLQITVLDLPTAYWHQLNFELTNADLVLPESLRLVIIGGEPALPEQVAMWQKSVASLPKLLNAYGPTEATVETTLCNLSDLVLTKDGQAVPIGRPIRNAQTYILDPYLQPVPIGVIGELHVGGKGLARSYLNRPDLTAERFIPNPFDTGLTHRQSNASHCEELSNFKTLDTPYMMRKPYNDQPGYRLYKTGDLARYLPDGNIEYIGRIDNQVKIRGFRIELGEIEAVLSQHPTVQSVVVTVREDIASDKRLVAYLVSQQSVPTVNELRNFLKEKLPDYMIPAAFAFLDAMPLTPNGKVDRHALPKPTLEVEKEESFVAPRNPLEQTLVRIWAEVLGLEKVGIHNNFFELGGYSLLATQLISQVRINLGVVLPLRSLFEAPTVAGLADRIQAVRNSEQSIADIPLLPVARDKEMPASFAQARVWSLDQLPAYRSVYNMAAAIRIRGRLNVVALKQTFDEILKRHEVLRTTFAVVDEQLIQVITQKLNQTLPIVELQKLPEFEREIRVRQLAIEEARQPFDLERGPLLRTALLRLSDEEHVLLLTIHHIASDGWSIEVLLREIGILYEAFSTGKPSPLPELAIQYADYAVWLRQWLQGEVLETLLSYWKQQLGGSLPILELPSNRPRPAVPTSRGAKQSLVLPKLLTEKLKLLSHQEGVTLFMTLLAGFKTLLYCYIGLDDILVGSPVANRNRTELEGLIGLFTNTVVLRTDLSGNPTFRELLNRVRQVTVGAYDHQDLPLDTLQQEVQPERYKSRVPLFQVLFAFQNTPKAPLEFSGLTLRQIEVDNETVGRDLTLELSEEPEGLHGYFSYKTDLCDATTIARMAEHFQILLESIVDNPDLRLLELSICECGFAHL